MFGYERDNRWVDGVVQTLWDFKRLVIILLPFVIVSACSQAITAIHGTPVFDLLLKLIGGM